MTKLLLVEDEVNLLNSLSFILEEQGFEVLRAPTGEQGISLARAHHPELALVDIGLPGIDGFEVAEQLSDLRRDGMTVAFLTGSDADDDMIRAFGGLADDYVVKPIRPRVLLARIGAWLARRNGRETPQEAIVCGPVTINPAAVEVCLDGKPLDLTPTEFKILTVLAQNVGRALTRAQIIAEVHGGSCHLTERSVDFQIHSLRLKLAAHAQLLVTVRGVGFKLRAS